MDDKLLAKSKNVGVDDTMKLRKITESYEGLPDEDEFSDQAMCVQCGRMLEEFVETQETSDVAAFAWYIKYPGDAYAMGPLRYSEWTTADIAAEDAKDRFGEYPAEIWAEGRTRDDDEFGDEYGDYDYPVRWPVEEFECHNCGEQFCPGCLNHHKCGIRESYEGLPDEDEFEFDEEMPAEVVEFVNFLNDSGVTPYTRNEGGIGFSDGNVDITDKITQHSSFVAARKHPYAGLGRYEIITPWVTPIDQFDEDGTRWTIGYYGETYSYGQYEPPWEAHQ